MKISVIGTGYVGLVSGVCLSQKGHQVICVDQNQKKIDMINSGLSPIYEKNLDKLIKNNIGNKFKATNDLSNSIKNTSVSIIAVGTPFVGTSIDLSFIKEVSKEIGCELKNKNDYHLVVVKSTVIPGTTDQVVRPILEKFSGKIAGKDFGISMNPEFLREGEAVSDFMHPDRIVLGSNDEKTLNKLRRLYKVFDKVDIFETNIKTAEMIKYTSNSLLATMISFSNEIGNLCSNLDGIDIVDVMNGVYLDKRISPILKNGKRIKPGILSYLEAGCGFGGSCFPKDVNALISHGKNNNNPMYILNSVMKVNKNQPDKIIQLILKHFPRLVSVNICMLGLAFKPGTDDIRESPAISVIKNLTKLGAKINVFDPVAQLETQKIFKDKTITYCNSIDIAIKNTHVVVIMTSWPEFKNLKEILTRSKINPLIVDGRRIFSKNDFEEYEGIGC